MKKRFLFHVFSSFTGVVVAMMIVGIICVAIIGGIVAGLGNNSDVKTEVKKGSILSINLCGEIQECEKPFSPSIAMLTNGNVGSPQILKDITTSIKEAATNKDIVAIYLKCGDLYAAPATLDALRNEIVKFKKTAKGEKKVYAYAEDFNQGCYYVASVADSIFMNPEGAFTLKGFSIPNFFFKGLLDKVGVKMQVAKVGTYKSAVEPYILEHISEPARAQLDTIISNMWLYVSENISASRKGVTPSLIDSLINYENISFASSDVALKNNLIDGLVYDRQMKQKLAYASKRKVDELNLVETSILLKKSKKTDKNENM